MIEEVGSADIVGFSCGMERNVDLLLYHRKIYVFMSVNHGRSCYYNIDNVPLQIALPSCKRYYHADM
jgi:hypothetical protein